MKDFDIFKNSLMIFENILLLVVFELHVPDLSWSSWCVEIAAVFEAEGTYYFYFQIIIFKHFFKHTFNIFSNRKYYFCFQKK